MAIQATEDCCPHCMVGNVELFNGVLRCTYCNREFAPATTRARLRTWYRHELEALERRLTRRDDIEFYELPHEPKELDF